MDDPSCLTQPCSSWALALCIQSSASMALNVGAIIHFLHIAFGSRSTAGSKPWFDGELIQIALTWICLHTTVYEIKKFSLVA